MKKMGRLHRPFFRVCVMDARTPRDGRVLEEVGYYDPMVPETDARAILNGERIKYWIGVGAQPSDKVSVLIKKYGLNGTHLENQKAALERLANQRRRSTYTIKSPQQPSTHPPPQPPQQQKSKQKKKNTNKAAETSPTGT
jgi:small subunit ribosomal protein S16